MVILSYYRSSDFLSVFFTTYLVAGIIGIIVACVFGAITKNINEGKGYDGGFAWGFWLGIIGIIVVSCRQPNPYSTYQRESIIRKPSEPANEAPPPGGWKCICGKAHAAFESSCVCGRSKIEVRQNAKKESNTANDNISTIKEYKKLLDDGIITQEEFDAKKKQLLGL